MSATLTQVQSLVLRGAYLISNHAYDELLDDWISAKDILHDIVNAELIEDYLDAMRGPSVLLLQHDQRGAIHTVWGIPKGFDEPAILITAYRPDPDRWSADFRRRRT